MKTTKVKLAELRAAVLDEIRSILNEADDDDMITLPSGIKVPRPPHDPRFSKVGKKRGPKAGKEYQPRGTMSQRDIAKELGVTQPTVHRIINKVGDDPGVYALKKAMAGAESKQDLIDVIKDEKSTFVELAKKVIAEFGEDEPEAKTDPVALANDPNFKKLVISALLQKVEDVAPRAKSLSRDMKEYANELETILNAKPFDERKYANAASRLYSALEVTASILGVEFDRRKERTDISNKFTAGELPLSEPEFHKAVDAAKERGKQHTFK